MDVNGLLQFGLLAFGSLFVIVDPLATAPAFLAMTPSDSPRERIRMARLACLITAGVLLLFSVTGTMLFRVFSITLPAFQIAASIVLLLVALDMLRAQRSRVHETGEETAAGTAKDDIAVTPLAIPMLAGPGAISTVIVLEHQAQDWARRGILWACIVGVALASYAVLHFAARGMRWLSPIALKIASRIMGLLLAAVAMQFLLNALSDLHLIRP
jgi:multiple antibiotic resistance protein